MHPVLARFLKDCDADQLVRKNVSVEGGNTNFGRFVEDPKQRTIIPENIHFIVICNDVCFYLNFCCLCYAVVML